MTGWIALAFLVLLISWAIWSYNHLIALKNHVANAWKQIDVQLKRRHDLIPNLVSTVKGMMSFEQETLEKVVQARSAAMGAQSPRDVISAESALTSALGKFFVLVESYPELKSNQNVLHLQEELSSTENKITFARQLYNDLATQYNTMQQQFPTNLIAGKMGFALAELWEITQAAERETPRVDLTLGK